MEDNLKIKIPQLCHYSETSVVRFSIIPNKEYNIRLCNS